MLRSPELRLRQFLLFLLCSLFPHSCSFISQVLDWSAGLEERRNETVQKRLSSLCPWGWNSFFVFNFFLLMPEAMKGTRGADTFVSGPANLIEGDNPD